VSGLCADGHSAGSGVGTGDSANIHAVMEGKGVCEYDGAWEAC